jgi:Transposase DDE domain group 1
MTMDVDSTICEVHGHHKGGAAYGYTRQLGYHPLLATRADTGEVLHARQRTGRAASGRGAERFVNELAGRVRRAGASGPLTLRADSGFWSAKVLAACRRHRIRFSITVRQISTVTAAIASIPEQAWVGIDYPDGGIAQVAEATLGGDRLVVRRSRLTGPQATLWPDWRYHAFVTDREGSAVALDADHRRHAVCELAIRDLKDGAGLRHCPSGVFLANAAWLVVATLAHNLLGWTATIGLGSADLVVAKTLRRRLLALPGRLTRSARRRLLHLPTDWPWATQFLGALTAYEQSRCAPDANSHLGRPERPAGRASACRASGQAHGLCSWRTSPPLQHAPDQPRSSTTRTPTPDRSIQQRVTPVNPAPRWIQAKHWVALTPVPWLSPNSPPGAQVSVTAL